MVLLFFVSFFAATLLPLQSEAVLLGLYLGGEYSAALLVTVAAAGNVLGSCVNWLLGRYALYFQDRRWFPVKASALDRARAVYCSFGIWTLLFAWVPIIGDPLTLLAGFMRVSFLPFVILVAIGKTGRYIAIVSVF